MVAYLRRLVASPRFNYFVLFIIILAGILVGLETMPEFDPSSPYGELIDNLQNIVLWLFVVEAGIKIASRGSRPWEYFYDPWNVFDFTVIVVCFLPLHASYAAVFRLARILRVLRLVSAVPKLQMLVGALLKSIPSLIYVGSLLLLHFYSYAVMGTFLFRDNDPVRFRNLPASMLSLFEVVTLEGWVTTMYTQMYGSDHYGYNEEMDALVDAKRVSTAYPIISPLYFVSFILLGTMIILNLAVGVIVNGMEEAQDEFAAEQRDRHRSKIGHITLGDEIGVVQEQLEQLAGQLRELQRKSRELHYIDAVDEGLKPGLAKS
jgi:voltage-gated sodium channel